MSNSQSFYRIVAITILFLSMVTARLFAEPILKYDPQEGGVQLVQKTDIDGPVNSRIVVTAKGAEEVSRLYGSMNGVLFQATARPDERLKSSSIGLSYKLQGKHNAQLVVKIDNQRLTSDAPAWVWAVAARFAHHQANGAVTLVNDPQTPAEKRFKRRWRSSHELNQRLVWARYHPVLDDTLMGFFLVTADALMGDAQHVRTMPDGLQKFDNYVGYSPQLDLLKSMRSARDLDDIIRMNTKNGDFVMLNEVDSVFTFQAVNGKLKIDGTPHYHFARKGSSGEYREIKLTEIIRKNSHLLRQANPLVSDVVTDFARLVAFFDYIDHTAPKMLDAFVADLQPVMKRIPTIKTPIAVPLFIR